VVAVYRLVKEPALLADLLCRHVEAYAERGIMGDSAWLPVCEVVEGGQEVSKHWTR
jgi:hypothetical protein